MIPSTTAFVDIPERGILPSETFLMNTSDESIRGYTDNIDAMKQAVFKILQTERYENLIYSGDYGIELADLYGQPISYVKPELERRISEALLQDERIISVGNYRFSAVAKGCLLVTFDVKTVFGEFSTERRVNF